MAEVAPVLGSDGGFAIFLHDLEEPMLRVADAFWVAHLAANEALE
jgi:hypothetical protein